MPDRHPSLLTRSSIFLMVDVQEKLYPYVANKEDMLKNIQKLLKFAKIMNIPVVVTEHYPKGLGRTIDEIKPLIQDIKPIEKTTFSCIRNEELFSMLKKFESKSLVIFGIESHICIAQTALDAKAQGYDVHVVVDAISSRSDFNKGIGVEKMRHFGLVMTSTETVLYEIMERKDIKEFKEVLPLLKD
jgi:nicotinamidase-related amidase